MSRRLKPLAACRAGELRRRARRGRRSRRDRDAAEAQGDCIRPRNGHSASARTPLPGVYEAVMGDNVAYVGSDGRHFLFGHLFDMRTQTDLTAGKLAARRSETMMRRMHS